MLQSGLLWLTDRHSIREAETDRDSERDGRDCEREREGESVIDRETWTVRMTEIQTFIAHCSGR